ncbi:hypothetical protein OGAPHI_005216 [Ogataea philodendri]|uniref:Mannan endo-1,6-alpha-mannosidase n=1 Tax=Ogataea philodendri TaxID=1378263 RepID=A0A9P8T2G2_9ASCO|nr:uncharacterized protein OGAPHI_005216 [Ogataea philodendri]KAH3663813.1 hypothetical protein OGAPHI_005216 [Ogataea philodendri]
MMILKSISFLLSLSLANALSLDVGDKDSVCDAATLIVDGMMDYYEGNRYGGTVGMFQAPYYWWEAGEAMGGLIDTWFFCKNDTYESLISQALLAQIGSDKDYMPSNQTATEGNDDQAFWGLAVLQAAERNFTNPSGDDSDISWIGLAQAVYNTMWSRWDSANCGGGLRWQIFTWNAGYDYKNTISNAGLFNIAARIARYTSNNTYAETAETVYDWLRDVGYVSLSDDGTYYTVYDGAKIGTNNCSTFSETQYSYNYALLLGGAAYMYNYTENETWSTEVGRLYEGISRTFLNNSIMFEYMCEKSTSCNNDQRSFKSVFSRMMGLTAKLVPDYHDKILDILDTSANGAAQSCSGGSDGHTCGRNWAYGGWDGWYGLGEQMSALEVIQNTLIDSADGPYYYYTGHPMNSSDSSSDDSSSRGGASSSIDNNAGLSGDSESLNANSITVKRKDRVGAGIVTAIVLAVLIGLSVWMLL